MDPRVGMAALLAMFVAACGGSNDGAPAPDRSVDAGPETTTGCTAVTVSAFGMGPSSGGGGSVVATPSPALGGDRADVFRVELIGAAFSTGEFDLSGESDYATCKHCVSLWVDGQEARTATVFLAESGKLSLTAVSSPVSSQFAGSLTSVRLVEVSIDPQTFATTRVPGGKCLELASAKWNTVVPSGGDCRTAADCIDTSSDVCDPTSGKCVPGQCSVTGETSCASTDICVFQARGTKVGACYPICKPFGTTCDAGSECVISRFDGTTGYCKKRSSGAPDSACSRSDLDTSCVAGHVCDSLDRKCRKQCDFFDGTVKCDGAQRCVPPGICTDGARDPARVGELCGSTASSGDACGETDTALSGVCAGTGPLTCMKWCRMDGADCPAGQLCRATAVPSIGTCG